MSPQREQAMIRQLTYLHEHPPVGIIETLAALTREASKPSKTFVEFRQPFARLPDDEDDNDTCGFCLGDKTMPGQIDGYGCEVYCPECGGEGTRPFNKGECFLTVYRDGHSIETLTKVLPDGTAKAWVWVSQPGFAWGKKIALTEQEQEVAQSFLKNSEPPAQGHEKDTEEV